MSVLGKWRLLVGLDGGVGVAMLRTFATKPKRAPRRSPTVKSLETRGHNPNPPRSVPSDGALPPLSLLRSARSSGVLEMEPAAAMSVLRAYQSLLNRGDVNWEKEILTGHQISLGAFASLSNVLGKGADLRQRVLAARIQQTASEMGHTPATTGMVETGLKQGAAAISSPLFMAAVRRLEGIAAREGHDATAMVVMGRVLLQRGQMDAALAIFDRASQLAPDADEIPAQRGARATAAFLQGSIHQTYKKDAARAETCFRHAAYTLDHPDAYLALARLVGPSSPEYRECLQQAAASGLTEAARELAAAELREMVERNSSPSSSLAASSSPSSPASSASPSSPPLPPVKWIEDFGLAREWAEVAAAGGDGPAMLLLASMHRAVNQVPDGFKWLDRAEAIPSAGGKTSDTETAGIRARAAQIKTEWRAQKDFY